MLEELTPDQFAEWQEYAELEPFGPYAQLRALANIMAAIAAACGVNLDMDDVLRSWDIDVPIPPFDPAVNEAAIIAAFGG